MINRFRVNFEEKIRLKAANDGNSKLGTYLLINPDLSKPHYEGILEFQRVITTRYRTGSHNLRIETGRRVPNLKREERLCICNSGVQTVQHILLECPLMVATRLKYGVVDIKSGITNTNYLIEMESTLGIKH